MKSEEKKALQPVPQPQLQPIGDDMRRQIAEAAYYLAERRGFAPGADLEDWLAAEEEITKRAQRAATPD